MSGAEETEIFSESMLMDECEKYWNNKVSLLKSDCKCVYTYKIDIKSLVIRKDSYFVFKGLEFHGQNNTTDTSTYIWRRT